MTTNEQMAAYYEAMARSSMHYAMASEADAEAARAIPDIEESDRAARVAAGLAYAKSYRESAATYERLAQGRRTAPAPSVNGTTNQPGAT